MPRRFELYYNSDHFLNGPDPIGTIGKVFELGNQITQQYTRYTHAKADLRELDSRLRTSLFVVEVFRMVIARGITGDLYRQRREITRLIDHLQGVFDRLDKQLSRFHRDARLNIIRKFRWTFKGKSGYEAILHEMAQWQSEVQGVVEAIKLLREYEKEEDRNLYKQLFGECGGVGIRCADRMSDMLHGRGYPRNLPPINNALLSYIGASDNLRDGNRVVLKGCLTFMECRYHSGAFQGTGKSIADTNMLASLLHQVDAPSMHILRCKGTIYQARHNRSLLFYEMPSEPTNRKNWTLAQAIEDRRTLMPPLHIRVRYAVEICMAVMFTHAAGLVHKSISPENVLVLKNSPMGNVTHEFSAYVVGFHAARLDGPSPGPSRDQFRARGPRSAQLLETNTVKRLYQHPERQITLRDGKVVRFRIRHDMYSLGVVLLELAMWRRLKHIDDRDLQNLIYARGRDFDPRKLQAKLAKLVSQSIVGWAGTKYTEAVLCCLQDTITNQWNERQMRELFYERVLQPLKQIIL